MINFNYFICEFTSTYFITDRKGTKKIGIWYADLRNIYYPVFVFWLKYSKKSPAFLFLSL